MMDDLERYVTQTVSDWISEIQERSPEPGEVEDVAAAVTSLAYRYIQTQILNALS